MKNKKKKIFSIVLIILIGITCFLLGKSSNKEETYFEDKPKQIKNEQTLSMMIEQTAGTGDYKMEERTSWPTAKDGYIFNTKLSKCANGGELAWDSTNNVVTMTGNMSDKCYIYFDFLPSIDVNFVGSTDTALKINVLDSDGELSDTYDTFYYSVDGGATYVSSSSNTYSVDYTSGTISNLSVYASANSNKSPNTFTKKVFNGGVKVLMQTITCSDNICGYNGVNKDYGSNTYYNYDSKSKIYYTDNMNGYLFNNITLRNASSYAIEGSGSNDYYIRTVGTVSLQNLKYQNWKNLYINSEGESLTLQLDVVDVSNLYVNSEGGSLIFYEMQINGPNLYISATDTTIRFDACQLGDITFNLNGTVSFNFGSSTQITGDDVLIKVTGNSSMTSGNINSFEDLSSAALGFLYPFVYGAVRFSGTTLTFDFNGFTFTLDEAEAYINSR